MLKSLLSWHKKCAVFIIVPFIIWSLSGLIHPFMSHFTKAERIKVPPIHIDQQALQHAVPLKAFLIQAGIAEFSHASLVNVNGAYFYQVAQLNDEQREIRYFEVNANQQHILTDPDFATYLAAKWTQQEIVGVTKVTEFDEAYGDINRILPVYRVELSNHNRIYIDTLGQRIAAHNTPLRETLSYWFRVLHTFSFIGDKHNLARIIPMLVISIAMFLTAIFGLIAYSFLWKKIKKTKNNTPKLHRVSGLSLSLCMLGFASSSIHILIDKFFVQEFRQLQPQNTVKTAYLKHDPLQALLKSQGSNFNVISVNNAVYSQIKRPVKRIVNYEYWQQAATSLTDTQVAQHVLATQLGLTGEVIRSDKVDKFGPTYGFINKRLPVIQTQFSGSNSSVYSVEISSGYIAAIDNTWQKARSWHFGNLHKYHFLNPLTKPVRDIILTFICFGLVFSAVMGGKLYLARRSRQKDAIRRRALNLES